MGMDILRGIALWVLCLSMIALTGWLAYQGGLLSFERRAHNPMVFVGFALAGVTTLGLFIAFIQRLEVTP